MTQSVLRRRLALIQVFSIPQCRPGGLGPLSTSRYSFSGMTAASYRPHHVLHYHSQHKNSRTAWIHNTWSKLIYWLTKFKLITTKCELRGIHGLACRCHMERKTLAPVCDSFLFLFAMTHAGKKRLVLRSAWIQHWRNHRYTLIKLAFHHHAASVQRPAEGRLLLGAAVTSSGISSEGKWVGFATSNERGN